MRCDAAAGASRSAGASNSQLPPDSPAIGDHGRPPSSAGDRATGHRVAPQLTMSRTLAVPVLVLIATSTVAGPAVEPSNIKGQATSIKIPNENEEESKSNVLPDEYRCEACGAVAWQMQSALRKAELKRKGGKKRLKEIEVFDTLANVCSFNDDFGNKPATQDGANGRWEYTIKPNTKSDGTKHVPGNRKNLLNGDGLPDAAKIWAFSRGGGKWGNRLAQLCVRHDSLCPRYLTCPCGKCFGCKAHMSALVKQMQRDGGRLRRRRYLRRVPQAVGRWCHAGVSDLSG
jgi:hypothetical protein